MCVILIHGLVVSSFSLITPPDLTHLPFFFTHHPRACTLPFTPTFRFLLHILSVLICSFNIPVCFYMYIFNSTAVCYILLLMLLLLIVAVVVVSCVCEKEKKVGQIGGVDQAEWWDNKTVDQNDTHGPIMGRHRVGTLLSPCVYNRHVFEDKKKRNMFLTIWSIKILSRESAFFLVMMAVYQSGLWWKRLARALTKPLHFKSTFDVSPLFFQATHASVVLWKTQTLRQY